MDIPCLFGTWEMLLEYVLLVSVLTVTTPCQGFGTEHDLISSCFADTLLLMVPHGHAYVQISCCGRRIHLHEKNILDARIFLGIFWVLLAIQ